MNRRTEMTLYNPHCSKTVITNVRRTFPKITDKEFPKNLTLDEMFSRNKTESSTNE